MTKHYKLVSNAHRKQLITLIHEQGYSISQAAKLTDIYYPTAKAINRVFKNENRIAKKSTFTQKFRLLQMARAPIQPSKSG
jgi:molybdenum-dependent DNA-binding transcriptional regulator ModE